MSSNSTDLRNSEPKIEWKRHSAERSWAYEALDRYQREIAARVRDGMSGRAIFSEVAPVVTLGKRETEGDFTVPESELRSRGISVYRTDRGGRATYHGPGQWVVFAVESLARLTGDPRGVRKASEAWLRVAVRVCRDFHPGAEARDGLEAGVWTRAGAGALKLASMGLKVEKGILLHGISVNGYATPESFFGIHPCGLDARAGYLLKSRDLHAFDALGQRLAEALKQEFQVFSSLS